MQCHTLNRQKRWIVRLQLQCLVTGRYRSVKFFIFQQSMSQAIADLRIISLYFLGTTENFHGFRATTTGQQSRTETAQSGHTIGTDIDGPS